VAKKSGEAKVEDISEMGTEELMALIKRYEEKYGASYDEFMKTFKDEEASFDELVDQFEWETYWLELRKRLAKTGSLKLSASSLKEYASIFTPMRMKALSFLLSNGEATVSEVARGIGKPIGSVLKALEMLRRHGLIAAEKRDGRKIYRPLIREIVITA